MPARRKQQRQAEAPPEPRIPVAPSPLRVLIHGFWVSQLLHVAAALDLADGLAEGPLHPGALAERVGADPEALRRVLRALASLGVFAEDADGRYALTPLAETLRSDPPQSLRDFARMMPADFNWSAWLERHPEPERVFAAAMASLSSAEDPGIAASYPFGELTRLVDVGGAHGHLLAAILRRHEVLTGVLYDRPQVVAGAEVRGWDDERCVRILTLCRDAFEARFGEARLELRRVVPTGPPGASVSVIEGVRA